MSAVNFEKAMADLERIVERLEKGDLPLNESMTLFEKGVKLARALREDLEKAEKKVEILLKDDKGELRREPFSLDGADEAEPPEDEEAK